jgi:hypothetical protein
VTDTDAPAGPGDGDDRGDVGSPPPPWWRRWWVWTAAAVVLIAAGVTIWPTGDDDTGDTAVPSTTSTSPSPSTSIGPTTVSSSPQGPSAANDLVAFFDAVETTDRELRAAADAVNGSIGVATVTFEQSTIDAIDRAEPVAAAAAIPAGLDPAAEQAVLLVYSDLVSRFASLNQGSCVYLGTRPRSDLEPSCFSQGHAAAERMPEDVAAARAVAEDSPPAVVPDPDSRAAAEVRLRIALIDGANRGCDNGGGFIATVPIPVRWYDNPSVNPDSPEIPPLDGEVGGIDVGAGPVGFWATYAPSTGWTVELNAC